MTRHPLDTLTAPTTPPWALNERHQLYDGRDQWTYLTTFLSTGGIQDLARITLDGFDVNIRGYQRSVFIRINDTKGNR